MTIIWLWFVVPVLARAPIRGERVGRGAGVDRVVHQGRVLLQIQRPVHEGAPLEAPHHLPRPHDRSADVRRQRGHLLQCAGVIYWHIWGDTNIELICPLLEMSKDAPMMIFGQMKAKSAIRISILLSILSLGSVSFANPNADIRGSGIFIVEHIGEHHRGLCPGRRDHPWRRCDRQAGQETVTSRFWNFHGYLGSRPR